MIKKRERPVTTTEAKSILNRFCASHFGTPYEKARISIPARPDRDDDLLMYQFIEQVELMEKEIALLRSLLQAGTPNV